MPRLKDIAIAKGPSFICPKFSKSDNVPQLATLTAPKLELDNSINYEINMLLWLAQPTSIFVIGPTPRNA